MDDESKVHTLLKRTRHRAPHLGVPRSKGAGTKTTPYVGQEEEEDVEEEAEEVEEVGAGRGKDKPHHPLMISVHKVRIRPGTGKGKTDGWFPQPLTHTTRRSTLRTPKPRSPCNSLPPKGVGA